MRKLLNKYYVTILLTIAGFLGGFSYWYFIGCASGTCPLKSNALIMTLYGGLIGGTIGSIISGFKKSNINT